MPARPSALITVRQHQGTQTDQYAKFVVTKNCWAYNEQQMLDQLQLVVALRTSRAMRMLVFQFVLRTENSYVQGSQQSDFIRQQKSAACLDLFADFPKQLYAHESSSLSG